MPLSMQVQVNKKELCKFECVNKNNINGMVAVVDHLKLNEFIPNQFYYFFCLSNF